MKQSKFTEEQIAFPFKQAELGTSVEEVCRKNLGCDVLQLAQVVRRARAIGAPPAEAARGGEREAEAPGRRPVAGQGEAAGRARKKALKPFPKARTRDRSHATLWGEPAAGVRSAQARSVGV